MLGIRQHKGVALDLFVGEPRLFASDAEIQAAALADGLRSAEASGKRHVAIHGAREPRATFAAIRNFLDGGTRSVRRVTCVLGSTDLYYEFQEVLFASFPE